MKMTFDEYDKLEEKFHKIRERTSILNDYFPTEEEIITYVENSENPNKYIPFLLFLLENTKEMELTDEQQSAQKLIQNILYEHLELFD